MENQLIHGDNLTVMEAMFDHYYGEFDLIYIDPPFATNNTFHSSHERSATISALTGADVAYSDVYDPDDYIKFLKQRIVIARELMDPDGSFYIHTDTKVGHYVKVMLDGIFGRDKFRNDITRIKSNPKNFSRRAYGNIKDTILFYTKSDSYIWNEPRVRQSEDAINRRYNKIDSQGRRYTTMPLHAPGETRDGPTGDVWRGMRPPPGRHWMYPPDKLEALENAGLIEWSSTGNPRKVIYADDIAEHGVRMQDVWEYKDPQVPIYPTQKNPQLLEKIIATSSIHGSAVLDFFCGSGTTLRAASILGRSWVGIDQSEVAVGTARNALLDIKYEFRRLSDVESRTNSCEPVKPALRHADFSDRSASPVAKLM